MNVSGMKKTLAPILMLFLSAGYATAQNPDIDILRRINAPNPVRQTFWLETSNSVYWVPPVYAVANLGYGLIGKDRVALRYSMESALSAGIGLALTGCIKNLVNRPRPAQAYPDIIGTYIYSEGKSFPSGHTTLAFATATTLALQGGHWYISVPVFSWPLAVGYSRMRLGRHYPTDVLCGAVIGIGSGLLSHWIAGRIMPGTTH